MQKLMQTQLKNNKNKINIKTNTVSQYFLLLEEI
jgi:hypothetical protein